MKIAVDLHIHTALSPCASEDMTPSNIVNMAILKGLDAIAITDHNSSGNCEAVAKCGKRKGIVVIPGMELETQEEVHLLCLFDNIISCMTFQDIVISSLPNIENREDIFGRQILMDDKDRVIGINRRLLLTAAALSIEEASQKVANLGGVIIPAHIDRQSYSILSNLGMIPENAGFNCLELSRSVCTVDFLKANPGISGFQFIHSSDAHELGDILERETFLEVKAKSTGEILAVLKKPVCIQ